MFYLYFVKVGTEIQIDLKQTKTWPAFQKLSTLPDIRVLIYIFLSFHAVGLDMLCDKKGRAVVSQLRVRALSVRCLPDFPARW